MPLTAKRCRLAAWRHGGKALRHGGMAAWRQSVAAWQQSWRHQCLWRHRWRPSVAVWRHGGKAKAVAATQAMSAELLLCFSSVSSVHSVSQFSSVRCCQTSWGRPVQISSDQFRSVQSVSQLLPDKLGPRRDQLC
eukprot:gene13460-biopygen6550